MPKTTAKPSTTVESVAFDRILNRELSRLDFDARVFELASDPSVPLLERVNFCSIQSSNLDEFFMVRVAGLMDQAASGIAPRSPDGRTPQETLRDIRERALDLMRRQSKLWKEDLCPALAERGISIAKVDDLAAKDLADLERVFEHDVFPVLTPLAVGPGQPFPYISGLSLSLGLFVRDPVTEEERFARVKVPEPIPRFLDGREAQGALIALEDAIGHFLPRLFPGMEILERSMFRVTRDADFELSDEADDLLEALQHELRRRRFGDCVRARGLRVDLAGDARGAQGRPRDRGRPGLPGARDARPRGRVADREARQARAEVRAVGRRLQAPVQQHARPALLRPQGEGRARPPPLRLLRDERRGVRGAGRRRSRRPRAQDDRLPHERRLARSRPR